MKEVVYRILIGVFAFTITYLIGAFTHTSFDISTWGMVGRSFVGIFGGVFSIAAMTFPNYKF